MRVIIISHLLYRLGRGSLVVSHPRIMNATRPQLFLGGVSRRLPVATQPQAVQLYTRSFAGGLGPSRPFRSRSCKTDLIESSRVVRHCYSSEPTGSMSLVAIRAAGLFLCATFRKQEAGRRANLSYTLPGKPGSALLQFEAAVLNGISVLWELFRGTHRPQIDTWMDP